MKNYMLLLFFALLPKVSFGSEQEPLVTIVLMVKDEADTICQTLQPYVQAGIDHYLIFDTGSKDDTISIARKYFDENDIQHAVIQQEAFVDFSTSRNRALDLAHESFPNGYFILMPDVQWHMHNVEGLIEFCKSHKDDFARSYLVRAFNEKVDFYNARLIRCNSAVRFVGVVHEYLNHVSAKRVPQDVYFELQASHSDNEKSRRRWFRDSALLLKEYERNPHNPRTVFYLAQTFACLGEWEIARVWYERRISMIGWDEETYIAYYKLADVYAALNNWDQALKYYLKAFSRRPQRAEPLVRLAKYYWSKEQHDFAFMFSSRAASLPYPHQDQLAIEKDVYDYVRYDVLGCCAWHVKEYEIGLYAVRKALESYPDMPHLQSNLDWYLKKIGG